jgi:hypothetical protein
MARVMLSRGDRTERPDDLRRRAEGVGNGIAAIERDGCDGDAVDAGDEGGRREDVARRG